MSDIPSWLDAKSKAMYKRLLPSINDTVINRELLAMLVTSYQSFIDAATDLRTNKIMTANGKMNQSVNVMRNMNGIILNCSKQIGIEINEVAESSEDMAVIKSFFSKQKETRAKEIID